MDSMRIFVACADEKLRLALLLLLDNQTGMTVVGLSDRIPGLLSQLEGSQPDVLLLSWDKSAQAIAALITGMQILENRPRVIVLSTNPQVRESVLALGVDFFICKDSPPDKLLGALNDILQSENLAKNEEKESKSKS